MSQTNLRDETIIIPLQHGGRLRAERDHATTLLSSLHLDDADGNEVVMWEHTEWEDDPDEIMQALVYGMHSEPQRLVKLLGRTKIVNRIWV